MMIVMMYMGDHYADDDGWLQDLSKSPPQPRDPSKTPPGGLLRPILGPKLMDFGPQVGRFVFDFLFNFDRWLVG